jgi:DNA-binding NarL/FixJ family response regulator
MSDANSPWTIEAPDLLKNRLAAHRSDLPPAWPGFPMGQQGAPMRVLLIDDDLFIRRVIAQELLSDVRILLEGQGQSLCDGRRLVATHAFDVLMIDLRLGDGSGFDLIQETCKCNSTAEIIVLSATEDEFEVMRAFELGATGFLLKNAWLQSFAQAVPQVANGGAAITPRLARRLLARLARLPSDAPLTINPMPCGTALTDRESEILRCISHGRLTPEIGIDLGISTQTVSAHVRNIYKKLHVHSRAQAVSYASRSGLL